MQYPIIGGPSTGKTSIIEELRKQGFAIVEDTARRLLAHGNIVKPTVDRHVFQQEVLREQMLAEEQALSLSVTTFLDGGVFDGCAYYLCDGLEVPAIYTAIDGARYRAAFLFEGLSDFVCDGIRYQDATFTRLITPKLEACYLQRGVKVIRVPNLSVSQRLELILSELAQQKPVSGGGV